jgi:hypothetical protein
LAGPHEQSPLERFCALLTDHGVEFIVVGGQDRKSLLQMEAIKRLREQEGLR